MIRVRELVAAPTVEALGLDLDEQGLPRTPLIAVDSAELAALAPDDLARATDRLRQARAVVVAIAPTVPVPPGAVSALDVVLSGPDVDWAGAVPTPDPVGSAERLRASVAANPVASVTLAWHLRASAELPVLDALAAESSAYSMLLAGAEFAAWLAQRGASRPPGPPERVRLVRHDDRLRITLVRPGRRNAVDALMRDALWNALQLPLWDESVRVQIDAEGPSFSAGGDLDEFGSASDPATAHLVRVSRSVGAAIHRLGDRVCVQVHGDCIGAGLELPAFAAHVTARPDARFRLPEIAMGLIPGAGGTVSLPRRIGRQRTAWLALTGTTIDANTARQWNLVDAIS